MRENVWARLAKPAFLSRLRPHRERQPPMPRPSIVYEPPRLSIPGVSVSAEEVDFFVANGFLVKRGLLNETETEAALDRAWAHLLDRVPRQPGWRLRREDPATWVDPQWAPLPPTPKAGPHAGRRRIDYDRTTVKLHDLGSADYLLRLVANNPAVREIAAALLGDLRPSGRTRGVYALFPRTPDATTGPAARDPAEPSEEAVAAAMGPHMDRVCQQLNLCVYLDDVPPRCGGFTLYPGSHREMCQLHRYHANWSPVPDHGTFIARLARATQPVELAGAKGDAIFWHGRMVHSAGAHFGQAIRWAVFADFTHDRPTLTDDEHRAIGQSEWFKDTRLFREDALVAPLADGSRSPGGNRQDAKQMWRGWQLGGYDTTEAGTNAERSQLRLAPFASETPETAAR